MQLSVVVHSAQWSVKEYVLSQQPAPGGTQQPGSTTAMQGASATTATAAGAAVASGSVQQAGGNITGDQSEAGSTVCLGPFTGSMKQTSDGSWLHQLVRQLQENLQIYQFNATHQVVLAERVSSTLWGRHSRRRAPGTFMAVFNYDFRGSSRKKAWKD